MVRQPLSLKARAIALLAQREHSRLELRRKLLIIERRQRASAAAAKAGLAAGEGLGGGARSAARRRAHDAHDAHDTFVDVDRTASLPGEASAEADAAEAAEAAEATVDALLDSLAAGGYLNETRFVESRVHQRASRFGVQRIQQELAQHGLKLDAEQQEALHGSELARAREVWLKRFGPEPAREPAEQARQMRFLLARGFSPDLVRRLLRAQGSLD